MRNFRTYRVWEHSIDLVIQVYKVTQALPGSETYSLVRQMQRAAISIPSNFAEGCARDSPKDFKRFVEMSLGSAYELETQLIIAVKLYAINEHPMYESTSELLNRVQAELNALRNTLK